MAADETSPAKAPRRRAGAGAPLSPSATAKSSIECQLNASGAKRGAKSVRNSQLGRIHILKRDLNDPGHYEDILWTVGRTHTAADLDEHGRRQAIAALEAALRKYKPDAPSLKGFRGRPRNIEVKQREELKKVEALLADAGLPWSYAEGLARRMYKRERLEFCDPGQLAGIITALHKAAQKRLAAELEQRYGKYWMHEAARHAGLLFGFDHGRRSIDAYPEAMSKLVRWHRGELAAACEWPARLETVNCCRWCYEATEVRSLRG